MTSTAGLAALYLVEVEIIFRLLELEFLALLLADSEQQVIEHVVVPVGQKEGKSHFCRPSRATFNHYTFLRTPQRETRPEYT